MIDLKLGNSAKILKTINNESVDMILTSPPYDTLRNYNNSLQWNFEIFKDIANELKRVLRENGVIIWVIGDSTTNGSESGTSFKQALYFKELGLNLYDTMIYRKLNYMPLTHKRYEQEFEYMFCFCKGKPKTFNPIMEKCKYAGTKAGGQLYKTSDDATTDVRYVVKDKKIKGNIFEYHTGQAYTGKYKHPAMFPLELALDQIKSWSNEGDIILDPFMGSGTTGVACKKLSRDFIGIEIVNKYFDIAQERINNTNVQLSILDKVD